MDNGNNFHHNKMFRGNVPQFAAPMANGYDPNGYASYSYNYAWNPNFQDQNGYFVTHQPPSTIIPTSPDTVVANPMSNVNVNTPQSMETQIGQVGMARSLNNPVDFMSQNQQYLQQSKMQEKSNQQTKNNLNGAQETSSNAELSYLRGYDPLDFESTKKFFDEKYNFDLEAEIRKAKPKEVRDENGVVVRTILPEIKLPDGKVFCPLPEGAPQTYTDDFSKETYKSEEEEKKEKEFLEWAKEKIAKGELPSNPEELFSFIGDSVDYMQNKQGLHYRDQNDNKRQFTDFKFDRVTKVRHQYRNGKPKDYYRFTITNNFGETHRILVDAEKISDLPKEIEKQAPTFQIFSDVCPRARSKLIRAAQEFLKEQTKMQMVGMLYVHHYWGWGADLGGYREFHDGSNANCTSEKKLLPLVVHNEDWKAAMKAGLEIFNLGEKRIIYPMAIYSLTSYMDALFTDAGYPLEHGLMIIGASGNRKTSLVKVIFNPFVPENEKVHTVRSTAAAMNILHQNCYDDTLVIDDINFEGTVVEIEAKKKNFRNLLRTYSDKTPRAKFGGEDRIKKNLVRGGCVFTAESNLTGQLASSELRYIKIQVNQPIDGEKLQKFQSNPTIWKRVVSEWIRFLADNYQSIVEYIHKEFPQRRTKVNIQEPRLVDAFIHLQLTSELLTSLIMSLKLISVEERNQFHSDFNSVVTELIAKQSMDATKQVSYVQFLSELWNLLGTNEVNIAPNDNVYIANMKNYIGYMDKTNGTEIIMLKRDKAYEAVVRAFEARQEFFSHSADEISKMLKDHNLTITEKNETLKRASSKIKGRPRMLALIRSNCHNLVNSINS